MRNSFGEALIPLLTASFRRALFVPAGFTLFDDRIVERERPEVLIQVLVERRLLHAPVAVAAAARSSASRQSAGPTD